MMELDLRNNYDRNNIRKAVIKFDHLNVWKPEESAWLKRRVVRAKSLMINDGAIRQGEFVALLGPSGAGKTTFLVSLAGKCTLPSDGVVTINGRSVKDLEKDVVEIVPQQEVFIESLSVMEHLIFMVEMKLGCWTESINRITLNNVINNLRLKSHLDTPIHALSGGERRLLSLAGSVGELLVSSPQIIICDEPTTGLDSYKALMVTDVLKKLSESGISVICSVHQPSPELFDEFESVMFMVEGSLVFHGTQEECKDIFERLNLRCPKNDNPAAFYLSSLSCSNKENVMSGKYSFIVDKMLETYRMQSTDYDEIGSEVTVQQIKLIRLKRHWLKQLHLLVWRSSLSLKREWKKHLLQLFICMIIPGLALSVCFSGISGHTQRGIQDIRGFLWLLTSEVAFNLSYNSLYAFEEYLALFKREASMYSASAFYVSRFLNFLPRCVVWPLTFLLITSANVRIIDRFAIAVKMSAVLIYTAIAGTAYGLGMGAMFISSGVTGDVMPCVDLPLFLMSGAFLRISSIPIWLIPLQYISHFYYSLDAMSNVYWRQIDYIECPVNSTLSGAKNGLSVLVEIGYSDNYVLQDSLGLLLVVVWWTIVGYIGLKREERKGYTY